MPYISPHERKHIDEVIDRLMYTLDPGRLNYIYTRLALMFVRQRGKKYLTFCIVIGTFVCAALEFYRRWVAPYEDKKITENGDVA